MQPSTVPSPALALGAAPAAAFHHVFVPGVFHLRRVIGPQGWPLGWVVNAKADAEVAALNATYARAAAGRGMR